MTSSGPAFEDSQRELNSHRDDDVQRAAQVVVGQLMQRGVEVDARENPGQLAALLSAVERFEEAVERRGGDSMINTPESSRPERRAYVVPHRHDDEPLDAYIGRVNEATERLG